VINHPARYSSGQGGRVATVLPGLEITHCQQQSQIALLAPYQDGTKQGRR